MSEYKERIVSSPYVAQVNNSENKQLYINKLVAHINIQNASAARNIDSIVLCFSGKNMLEHNLEDYEDENMEYTINSDKSITVTRLDASMGSASTASAYKYFYTNSNDAYDGTIIHTPIYGSTDTLYFSDGSTQSNLNNITYRYTMGGNTNVTYVPSSDNTAQKLIEDISSYSIPMRTISQCRFIFTDDTVSNMQVPFTMKPMIEYGSASGIYEAYDGAKYQVIVGTIFTANKDYTYDILEGKIYDENKTVILDNIQIPNINRYFKNGINNVWFYFANSNPTTSSKKSVKALSVTTSKQVSPSKPFYESSISLELHYLEPVQTAERYLIQGTTLTSIANAIRTKESSSDPIDVDDFATKIANIPSGSTLITKSITENGTYDAEDDDADGYSTVVVAVPGEIPEGYVYSIGDSAIDLGYKHNANTKVVCKLVQNAAKGGFYYAAFGARSDSYRTDCMIFFSRFNGNRYCYSRTGQEASADEWWNQNYESSSYSYYGKPIIVTCEGNTCSWYEESNPSNVKSITASSSTVDSGRANMAAFAMNNTSSNDGWSPNEYAYNTQIYWLKIYENDVLLHEFIPVQYGSDACLYDTVEQTYHYDRVNGGKFMRSANFPIPEPITDLTSFTKIYNSDSSISFDNGKMSTFMDKTDRLDITSTMMSGWRQSACYTSEDKVGAYGGWTSSTDMNLSFVEFFITKYEQQNKSLPVKLQYLDSNNVWQTITTVNVAASTPYPYNKFLVEMPENTEIYGIRWNHDTENKSSGNNICFFGMLLYPKGGES